MNTVAHTLRATGPAAAASTSRAPAGGAFHPALAAVSSAATAPAAPSAASAAPVIEVRELTKRFGTFHALDDVSLEVPGGGLVALLGPSGSGKTTLLRILAGLERPDRGRALIGGVDLASQSARQRNVGLVFQHYALFRHLDVYENIAFALRVRKRPQAEVDARVRELLALIQLESLGRRLPAQLSGGQRQRVALARALAARPRVLLLDEPFGALDAQVRAELRGWLRRLHDEIHLTTVFVTHDQDEAFEVADRVVVMNHGKIEQVGAPAEVFEHPANDFVMRFLGHVNVLEADIAGGRARVGDVTIALGSHHDDARGRVYVRPHEVDIARSPSDGALAARVLRVTPLSGGLKIELSVPSLGSHMRADIDWERGTRLALHQGDDVFLSLRRARAFAHGGAAAAP
ncbi:MAG TPA: sulfate ABC transporter ATP-binding protein [Kofleriaceae bacterium]|nr:sulfate ABC transporter ATP-binding protein [Kofleriaceae bacterium]